MAIGDLAGKRNPFGALLGVSSFLAALLYVSGFAYRWSYYYNFGVQHVVFKLSVQSFLVTAIELVRYPKNLLLSFLVIVCPVILLNWIVGSLRSLADRAPATGRQRAVRRFVAMFVLDSPLALDLIRASLLIYLTYALSAYFGAQAFRRDVIDSPENKLPVVTAILDQPGPGDGGRGFPLSCPSGDDPGVPLIGDAKGYALIQRHNLMCSKEARTWRLLYRDDASIYLFASDGSPGAKYRRPLTLVLPNHDRVYLVLR